MKLDDELKNVISRLEQIKDKIPPYAEQLKASKDYKDFETRLANDCLKAAVKTSEICSWYDKYNCNDTHITTLAKKALKAVYTITK